ncbi:unnamed protein product, partial [Sphacelaria rigidula]
MASKRCRDRKACIKINAKNTTAATFHLSSVHGIMSRRGQDVIQKVRNAGTNHSPRP